MMLIHERTVSGRRFFRVSITYMRRLTDKEMAIFLNFAFKMLSLTKSKMKRVPFKKPTHIRLKRQKQHARDTKMVVICLGVKTNKFF